MLQKDRVLKEKGWAFDGRKGEGRRDRESESNRQRTPLPLGPFRLFPEAGDSEFAVDDDFFGMLLGEVVCS